MGEEGKGSHLCSLLVDLGPVGLQRDDPAELEQGQVCILDVLGQKGQSADVMVEKGRP